jgi:hypothetical protein
LNKLPKVKEFITKHASKFDLEVNFVGMYYSYALIYMIGGDPRLVFLDKYGTELITINISDLDAEGISKVLQDHGFKKREYNFLPKP